MPVTPEEFLAPGLVAIGENGITANGAKPDLPEAATIFVVDLEMSGPNAQVHEVLDIGGVLAQVAPAFPESGSFGSRIRPKRIGNADHGALKVVGYSAKDWNDAPELEGVFGDLHGTSSGALLAGWGLEMDVAFLQYTFATLGMAWPYQAAVVDIQSIARRVLGREKVVDRFNLGHVADRLGIGRMGEHSALADAYATYDVLVKLWERSEKLEASS